MGDSRIGKNAMYTSQNRNNEIVLNKNLQKIKSSLMKTSKDFTALLKDELTVEANLKTLFSKLSCTTEFTNFLQSLENARNVEYTKVLFTKLQLEAFYKESHELIIKIVEKLTGTSRRTRQVYSFH